MSLKLLLLVLTGLFWSIAYFDIIRVGLKQKTYGMPFLALSLNLTWELYNTVQGFLMVGFHIANTINLIWVVMDLMILLELKKNIWMITYKIQWLQILNYFLRH